MDNAKACCLAIFGGLGETAMACLELCLDSGAGSQMSLLRRPGADEGPTRIFRFARIGALICAGPLAQDLAIRQDGLGSEFGDLHDVLGALAIPPHHHAAYERALTAGHVLFILQGPEQRLRRQCRALANSTLEMPVLYVA